MRLTILHDKKITKDQLDRLKADFTSLFPIKPTYFTHERDYSFYPTFIDSDGDKRPTNDFLVQETDWVHKKYGKWGTDHVFVLIHEDNWLSDTPTTKGIWGTNYSNIYHGYQVHYCRFDRDNPANSLGTFYHELMHSLDALIKTETGVEIAKLIPVESWDSSVVHGKNAKFDYIRHKENIEVIDYIESFLRKSYANRQARFDKHYSTLVSIVKLLQTLVVLLRQQLNRKNGVNKCVCLNHDH